MLATPKRLDDVSPRARASRSWLRVSIILLVVGTLFLLLLDGQVFTNSIAFLGCLTLSLVIWLFRAKHGLLWGFMVGFHILAMGLVASGLRENYGYQRRFNARRAHNTKTASQDRPSLPHGESLPSRVRASTHPTAVFNRCFIRGRITAA